MIITLRRSKTDSPGNPHQVLCLYLSLGGIRRVNEKCQKRDCFKSESVFFSTIIVILPRLQDVLSWELISMLSLQLHVLLWQLHVLLTQHVRQLIGHEILRCDAGSGAAVLWFVSYSSLSLFLLCLYLQSSCYLPCIIHRFILKDDTLPPRASSFLRCWRRTPL